MFYCASFRQSDLASSLSTLMPYAQVIYRRRRAARESGEMLRWMRRDRMVMILMAADITFYFSLFLFPSLCSAFCILCYSRAAPLRASFSFIARWNECSHWLAAGGCGSESRKVFFIYTFAFMRCLGSVSSHHNQSRIPGIGRHRFGSDAMHLFRIF